LAVKIAYSDSSICSTYHAQIWIRYRNAECTAKREEKEIKKLFGLRIHFLFLFFQFSL